MDKLDMQSKNLVDDNIEKIAKLFPNCITEGKNEDGQVVRLVDFDLLKQELSKEIVEGNDERYTLNWAGKKQAILTANSPINATLRPCREESVDFDNTKNLYIEGDNLDVLKLLRETYLGKVKMIYIDPPYNTGNDFVYEDDFATSTEDYLKASKSYDEQGNQLFQNNDSNGRFHSDWLSMMYCRLKLAKDLLSDNGAIFISIDDNEKDNLKKLCDDVFGETNYVSTIVWKRKRGRDNSARWFSKSHEYCLIYSKRKEEYNTNRLELDEETKQAYKNPDNDPRGVYRMLGTWARGTQGGVRYDFTTKDGQYFSERLWLFSKENLTKLDAENKLIIRGDNIYRKMFIFENEGKIPETIWDDVSNAANASDEIKKLFNEIVFDTPKPTPYIKQMLRISTSKEDLVLDFFSGSATVASATMELNAEDGGNRKFIMVQLPENCDEKSEAYKAGYKNICEIGKERIRRAGKKIVESLSYEKQNLNEVVDNKVRVAKGYGNGTTGNPNYAAEISETFIDLSTGQREHHEFNINNEKDFYRFHPEELDIGFRVLKLDSSCMKDVYYSPNEVSQNLLERLEDNIKEDRTPEDLLFQVMLDMGVVLSSEIKTLDIKGKKVFNVNDGNLVCCFDKDVSEEVVTEIAKMQPLYAVFRDASMSSDSVAVNFDQIFETYSPTTTRKVL